MAAKPITGPVIYASDASPEALEDAKAYIKRFGLTSEDVALVRRGGATLVVAKRDCSAKLIPKG